MAAKVQKIIMGAAVFILSATYAHDGIRLHAVPKARNLNNPILRPSGRSVGWKVRCGDMHACTLQNQINQNPTVPKIIFPASVTFYYFCVVFMNKAKNGECGILGTDVCGQHQ